MSVKARAPNGKRAGRKPELGVVGPSELSGLDLRERRKLYARRWRENHPKGYRAQLARARGMYGKKGSKAGRPRLKWLT
jgi:hypothetical protein